MQGWTKHSTVGKRLTASIAHCGMAAILLVTLLTTPLAAAQASPETPLPRIDRTGAHPALIVDGAPYLMLSAQINNSSAWAASMPAVWPVVDKLGGNTLEAPIYWETLEPQEGTFDYAQTDMLLAQARAHGKRLVLLWFGAWKNGSPGYTPEWIKRNPQRFPLAVDAKGTSLLSLSPFAKETLAADQHAFTALLQHLKTNDTQHTVIMVQVENEIGVWGSTRDFSPVANRAFAQPVPPEVARAMGKPEGHGTWAEVFGGDANEVFYAWALARYVEQIAAAGKRVYSLPMYVNAALRDPLPPGAPGSFESGGPTFDVLPLWHAVAPSLDGIEPDLYMPEPAKAHAVFAQYALPWNAFFVPETGNRPIYAHYFFSALAHGAMGWSPFGMDATGYFNAPLGAADVGEQTLAPVEQVYAIAGLFGTELARFSQAGQIYGTAEGTEEHSETVAFGPIGKTAAAWSATVSYGLPSFYATRPAPGNPTPEGEAMIVPLGANEFLVTGLHCRIEFKPREPGKQRMWISVEEGAYHGGTWQGTRLWNGDQTDYGLNFTSIPQLLRVRLQAF